MTKKYPSKVSYGLLTFIFLVFYGPLIPDLINGELNAKSIGFIGVLSVVFAFIAHLFLKTQYTIDHNKLKIKCGLFSFKPIDIDEIKEISKTKSIISSPAPSFDRIEIKYGQFNKVIVSPKDKYHFVEDLTKINPRIKNKITE
ncbi:PH domain-containing protein [Aquimarina rubra]|uniref:PH domain-containing protein n=1 Tax=Aquimarina rubra TaxID=1920033 RepID=A0ABW5LA62_9FLAO